MYKNISFGCKSHWQTCSPQALKGLILELGQLSTTGIFTVVTSVYLKYRGVSTINVYRGITVAIDYYRTLVLQRLINLDENIVIVVNRPRNQHRKHCVSHTNSSLFCFLPYYYHDMQMAIVHGIWSTYLLPVIYR